MAENTLLQYEMMVMLKPDLTQKATKDALKTVREMIAEAGGSINHEDLWEKRDLAYSIKGYDEAYYVIMYFTLDPSKLADLKADLDLEQPILRKMVIKFPNSLTLQGYLEETKRIATAEEAIQAERAKEQEAREEKARLAAEARAARQKKKEASKSDDEASESDATA